MEIEHLSNGNIRVSNTLKNKEQKLLVAATLIDEAGEGMDKGNLLLDLMNLLKQKNSLPKQTNEDRQTV